MSRKTSRRKLRVSIPAINLGVLRGDDDMEESKSRLEKKREELEELELESEIVDTESRIHRRRRALETGQDVKETESQKDRLADRLVDDVVIPIVQKNLEPRGRGEDTAVASKALDIARSAMQGTRVQQGGPNIIDQVFNGIQRIKELTTDDRTKEEIDEIQKTLKRIETGEGDRSTLKGLEDVLGIVDRLKEYGIVGGRGNLEESKMFIDHERWKSEFERDQKTRDRAFDLRMRHQDKQHDLEMAKLGIQRERNELLEGLVGRIGETVADALMEENELEEEEKPRKGKPRKKEILELNCPDCGAKLSIPPEGQTPGSEIECPKCGAISKVTEE